MTYRLRRAPSTAASTSLRTEVIVPGSPLGGDMCRISNEERGIGATLVVLLPNRHPRPAEQA